MTVKRAVQAFILVLIDLLAFYIALFSAIFLRAYVLPTSRFTPYQVPEWYFQTHLALWWMPLVFILAIAYEGLYFKRLPFWEEMRLLVKAVTIAFFITLAIVSLGKLTVNVSRLLLTTMWFVSLITFPSLRWIGKKVLSYSGLWKQNVLILGAGNAGRAVLKGLERENMLGYKVIGFLDDDPEKIGTTIKSTTNLEEYRVFGQIHQFKKFVRIMKISTIVIAMPSLDPVKHSKMVSEVQRYVSHVLLVPQLKGIALLNTELRALFMEQLFLLKIRNNLRSLYAQIIKRCFDIIVSSLFLVVLSPVFLILYLAVKLTSPGPAIFVQKRPGKNGKIINVYKFRTMYLDGDKRLEKVLKENPELAEEWRVYRKLKTSDPRVTPVGKFLRKSSLDELPQIFNVFVGQMSMVGPRPYMISEIAQLEEAADIILMTKPGLCGLWQCSGRNELSFEDRVQLEEWYVLNWSLWLDIILMFKTAGVVLTAKGAY